MVENIIQIKSGMMIKAHVSVKDIIHVKKIIFGILGKYLANVMDDSVIMCDEIIDAEAKSYDKQTKTIPTNFNEKK